MDAQNGSAFNLLVLSVDVMEKKSTFTACTLGHLSSLWKYIARPCWSICFYIQNTLLHQFSLRLFLWTNFLSIDKQVDLINKMFIHLHSKWLCSFGYSTYTMKLRAISRTYTKLRMKMTGSAIMKISFSFLNSYVPKKFYGIQQFKKKKIFS